MSDFHMAFAHIVDVEGGFVSNPVDPGGATKYGISQRSYPLADIRSLTLEDAEAIYLKDFWIPAKCDQLPWPLSLFVFDAAVNQGVTPALRMLQKALGVATDGIFGPATKGAVAKADQFELCAMFMADRALRYTGTRNFDTFGRGWFKRLFIITMRGV